MTQAGARWPVLLLVAAAALTWANALSGPFVYDDLPAIVDNERIRSLWPPWRSLTAPPQSPVAGRPVVALSLALNHAAFGLDVRGFHLVNLAVHALCGLLLFGVVRRTLLVPALRSKLGGAAPGIALATALLWLVHPLQTEVVDYTIQRSESLMGLFYLLTLWCAIRSAEGPRPAAWHAAAVAACALGMATKETMVTAPVVVALHDLAFRTGTLRETVSRRRGLWIGLGATWLVLMALVLPGPRSASVGFALEIGAWDYALNQASMLLHYLKLVFWPHPLTLDYGIPRPVGLAQAWPSLVAVAALLIATGVALVRWPALGFPGAWFFLILAPTSSVVPIVTEVGAERRMYLPLAAPLVLVVVLGHLVLARLHPRGRTLRRATAAALVVVAAAGLAWATARRNEDYESAVSIWQSAVRAVPDNPRAHANLGHALQLEGRLDEALGAYGRALAIEPRDYLTRFDLGTALAARGRLDEAIEAYREALRRAPGHAPAHNELAIALARRGETGESVSHFREALRLAPSADAHYNLGNSLSRIGRGAEALEHLREAIRLAPDRPAPLDAAAWVLATSPDPAVRRPVEAVRLAERAAEVTGRRDAGILDTLAAAYASAGRFDEAIAAEHEALARASERSAGAYRERLVLYQRHEPYVERDGV